MKCGVCKGLGILPGLSKNTKCSYCDWGDSLEHLSELERKLNLYDKLLQEVESEGYSGIGDMIDSAKEWKKIAETQAEMMIELQNKVNKLYVKDWQWQGGVYVVAESREEATELALQKDWHVDPEDWEEHEVKTAVRTFGDQ